ncbi:MAG: winged helix DNA-binding domain-containing protein [Actinomycetota bacterium]
MNISDAERRRRLIRRHHLGRTAPGVVEAVRGVAALHSTDPAGPYLAAWARVPGFQTPDLENELCERRTLWRMHTIRRTLFIVPEADAPYFEAGAGRDIARRERARLVGWLSAELNPVEVAAWLDQLAGLVLDALTGKELGTRKLTTAVPDLATQVTLGSGRWAARVPVSSRLLFLMAMAGLIVRTRTPGSWRASQYRWATVADWRGEPLPRVSEVEGRAEVARRYLATHGPVTLADLRWWTGWTATAAKQALAGIEAVAVELECADPGWVLPGDGGETEPPDGAVVTLLPALDSTPMGFRQRDWYLGPHAGPLFDANGNIGPTVWVDGRIVGGWGQRSTGEVAYELLEGVDALPARLIADEAKLLTGWLAGAVVQPRFPTPLARDILAGKGQEGRRG